MKQTQLSLAVIALLSTKQASAAQLRQLNKYIGVTQPEFDILGDDDSEGDEDGDEDGDSESGMPVPPSIGELPGSTGRKPKFLRIHSDSDHSDHCHKKCKSDSDSDCGCNCCEPDCHLHEKTACTLQKVCDIKD